MNEINLTKILKPGMKIYSLIDGEVKITNILDNNQYPIRTLGEGGSENSYSKEGHLRNQIGECVLFPSKENRNWNNVNPFLLLQPKEGDYLVTKGSSCDRDRVFIYNGVYRVDNIYAIVGAYAGIDTENTLCRINTSCWTSYAYRYATDEEIKEFDERLKEVGFYFDKAECTLKEIDTLPKTWEKCLKLYKEASYLLDGEIRIATPLSLSDINGLKDLVPLGLGKPVLALHQLLICRNAWWNKLGYKPNWGNEDEKKYIITRYRSNILVDISYLQSSILAFPTGEVAEKFRNTFKDLIEQAKELI